MDHTEKTFEAAIEESLLQNGGYTKGDAKDFDADLALFPSSLVTFLKETQPEKWDKLAQSYGAQVEQRVVQNIARSADQHGMLHVLRHGVKDRGVKLNLAYFMPANRANPDTVALYEQNRLEVTRQVHHSPKNPALSIDVVLSVNGLPIATAELKQPFTGQTVKHAMKQYKNDRDPRDPLLQFKRRCLVHFAVDSDEVFMATRLMGKKTFFLPFNKGCEGGAGNPLNPTGFKTAYLWEEIWAKPKWMEILSRFIHLQKEEKKLPDGKIEIKETLIFPRFHQLDAVSKLLTAAQVEKAGHNYLIQHSAGSGKSNSIAWLAHRLANLHDEDDHLIFDSVIVITDRRVLDKQLQDNIYQIEHRAGVVECIDKNAAQLGTALQSGKRIIITTLQKFSFVNLIDEISAVKGKNFAIIADEAHSSQTGEAAARLKEVLSTASLEEAEGAEGGSEPVDEMEEAILAAMEKRGPQANLSFFAFTATPKKKTLEMFGRNVGADGLPLPFHLYSMRQAIEEGFIHDVLRNYTTYKTFWKIAKQIEDDPELDKKKAKRAIARFVSLHPHNLAQKTEVMVEHFRSFTRSKIGGKAKAMVVTRSRLHAVRYKEEFDRYIRDKGYNDVNAIVAFSGTVNSNGDEYTEAGMNGFGEKELPEKFNGDDLHILIVAEKYQTGFDQPKLHTMYVDKTLKGVAAVQTLSRLNRTTSGKEDTFVLDFANDALDIMDAFQPYYERTEIDQQTDPNQLYTLQGKLDQFQYYYAQDVGDFAATFFKAKDINEAGAQGRLHAAIDPAVARFNAEPDEERQEDFRSLLQGFIRLYGFLSQLVEFKDPDLEKLYVFGRLLRTKLPKRENSGALHLDEDVELEAYKIQKTFEDDISLASGDDCPVYGPNEVGTRKADEERGQLSEIIRTLNDKFGSDLTEEDKLFFDQMTGDMAQDDKLMQQARTNSMDQFKHAFDQKANEVLVKRLEKNAQRFARDEEIATKLMSDPAFRSIAFEMMLKEVYEKAQGVGI